MFVFMYQVTVGFVCFMLQKCSILTSFLTYSSYEIDDFDYKSLHWLLCTGYNYYDPDASDIGVS